MPCECVLIVVDLDIRVKRVLWTGEGESQMVIGNIDEHLGIGRAGYQRGLVHNVLQRKLGWRFRNARWSAYVLLLGHVGRRLVVTPSLVQRQLLFVWQDSQGRRCRRGCGASHPGHLLPRSTLLQLWWPWSLKLKIR